jgi:hypothetical protein
MILGKRSGNRVLRLRDLLFPDRRDERRKPEPQPLPLASFSVLCTGSEPRLLVALTPIEPQVAGDPSLYALSIDQAAALRDELAKAIEGALARGEEWPAGPLETPRPPAQPA